MRDWKAAEALLRSKAAEGKDTAVHGLTLADCIQKFLDAHTETIRPKTLGQHRLVLDRLDKFAHSKNKFFMNELNVDLLEDFKTYIGYTEKHIQEHQRGEAQVFLAGVVPAWLDLGNSCRKGKVRQSSLRTNASVHG